MFTEEQANDYRKDIQTIISIKEKIDLHNEERKSYNKKKIINYIDEICEKYDLTFKEGSLSYIDRLGNLNSQNYEIEFSVYQNNVEYNEDEQEHICLELEENLIKVLLHHYRTEDYFFNVYIYFE